MARTPNQLSATEYRKYLLALGKFVSIYSQTEAMWHAALRRWAGVDEKISRALTGGMRGGEVTNTLRKIMQVVKIEKPKENELKSLITQFNDIAQFRDRLIHRGASYSPDFQQLVSTNDAYYRTLEDFETLAFNRDDMKHASQDLGRIMLRLLYAMLPDGYSVPGVSEKHQRWIHAPWSYKLLRPETPNRPKNEKKPLKRARLRHA
jgi:hypothetical protein